MLRRFDPFLHSRGELVRGYSGVRRSQDLENAFFTGSENSLPIAPEQRGNRFLRLPLRVLGSHRRHPIEREQELERKRLFCPERTVVVERRDPFRDRYEFR